MYQGHVHVSGSESRIFIVKQSKVAELRETPAGPQINPVGQMVLV